MPYKRSIQRLEFDQRSSRLIRECNRVASLPDEFRDVRDMVFQCAVFQTSAAVEMYLKLLVEGWAQALRQNRAGDQLPDATRGFLAAKRFEIHFTKYTYFGEESALSEALAREHKSWPILNALPDLPNHFDGKSIHAGCAYPSLKNLKKLFFRLGIDSIDVKIARILRRDVETMIDGFQSVRTAVAHAAPQAITLQDVRRLISDMKQLVRAIDRTFYAHVSRHGGVVCWNTNLAAHVPNGSP